jgi:mRNA-degrading endonuclease RelE of RelBE toxin-antitoxin system
MTKFELELSPAAIRDLKALPLKIQKEIVAKHLPIIREKPYQVGKP